MEQPQEYPELKYSWSNPSMEIYLSVVQSHNLLFYNLKSLEYKVERMEKEFGFLQNEVLRLSNAIKQEA